MGLKQRLRETSTIRRQWQSLCPEVIRAVSNFRYIAPITATVGIVTITNSKVNDTVKQDFTHHIDTATRGKQTAAKTDRKAGENDWGGSLRMEGRVSLTFSPSKFFQYTSEVEFSFIKMLRYTITFNHWEIKYINNGHACIHTYIRNTYVSV